MERRVQFLNNLLLLLWAGILVLTFYSGYNAETRIKIPDTWLDAGDSSLVHQNGTLYYQGRAFSGWLYENFANGNRAKEIPYYDGKMQGIMKTFYPDRAVEQERLFVTGQKQGIHRGWWPNGAPKFEYHFMNDEHNGEAKEWLINRRLFRIFRYNMGHEEGLQQMWWDNGTVRANYVVKNGREFGLIGRKLCKNVYQKK